nr:hypothetical protein [Tanacetum cinerariifolium]
DNVPVKPSSKTIWDGASFEESNKDIDYQIANRTISWLDNQEEKPDPSEMKKIASEGILTCLQDAIDSLNKVEEPIKRHEELSDMRIAKSKHAQFLFLSSVIFG